MARKRTAENGSKWRPSQRQIEIALLLLNPEDRRTKKAKIDAIGLPERTFYRWMKDERFINYLNDQMDLYTNAELVAVWHALINQCKRGNVPAIKLFMELKGLYKTW